MVQAVLCVVLTRQSYYRTISYYIHSTPDYDYVLWIQLHTMSRLRDGQIFTFPPSLCIFSLRLLITSPELGNWHLLGRDDSPVGELWTKYNESYLYLMEINIRPKLSNVLSRIYSVYYFVSFNIYIISFDSILSELSFTTIDLLVQCQLSVCYSRSINIIAKASTEEGI